MTESPDQQRRKWTERLALPTVLRKVLLLTVIGAIFGIILPNRHHEVASVSPKNTYYKESDETMDLRGLRGFKPFQIETGRNPSCIAVLVPSNESDLRDLCFALRSLHFLQSQRTPVLVFNQGDLSAAQRGTITQCTELPVAFPVVNFQSYPNGFDPQKEMDDPSSRWVSSIGVELERPRWGYQQMIRFWTTNIWKHPAIQEFETVMRIDTDSCFLDSQQRDNPEWAELPSLAEQYVYQCKEPGEGSNKFIGGLYNFTLEFMIQEHIVPKNPELFNLVTRYISEKGTLPVTQTNYEIARRSFFQRDDVMKWHEALTEHEPFGVFRRRWGDAQTRLLTLALFAPKEAYQATTRKGYAHGRGKCAKYENELPSLDNYPLN